MFYTGKNDGIWLLWGIFKECLKQNIITAVLIKVNAHSVVICRLIKKINNVDKNRSKRKTWFKLRLWGFSKKESYVVHMSLYTTRGRNSRQLIPDTVVQWSTPWVVFLRRPIKVPLVCGFSPLPSVV